MVVPHKARPGPQRPLSTVPIVAQRDWGTLRTGHAAAVATHDRCPPAADSNWLFKNKEHGIVSAAASMGALLMWDVDGGLAHIDKFLYSNNDHITAGALLAVGVVNTGVRNECDPALALLTEHVDKANTTIKTAAVLGLGFAYIGSRREEVRSVGVVESGWPCGGEGRGGGPGAAAR